MADIFNEVDEELRRERLKQFWDRYGSWVIAVALFIVLAVGGWRGYQWWEAKRAAEAGAVFESAIALASEGKHEEAAAAFARIADGGTSYRTFARLREAAELAYTDRAGAVRLYDSIVADSDVAPQLQDLARVRGALLLLDSEPPDAMHRRLEPALANTGVFRHSARELMAFAAWRAGDSAGIKRWFDAIVADPASPAGVRTRTEMLMALSAPAAGS